ncbi:MAG: DUF167 domain-containing protein [Candidatus Pacebacteria bacterium]|nr:DUF167 domain-containing protein [Candidatus Paceibacterota bacterium]
MNYIHVAVTAGAKKESFSPRRSGATGVKPSKDHFEISVKEKAERNMANTRVLEIIAEHFNVPKNKVRIINGHRHPSKLLVIEED